MTKDRVWNTSLKGSVFGGKECRDFKKGSIEVIDEDKLYTQDDFAHHIEIWKTDKRFTLSVVLEWILVTHPFHDINEADIRGRVRRLGTVFMNRFLKRYPSKNGNPTKLKDLGRDSWFECLKHFALYTEEEKQEVKNILIDEVWEYSKNL